MAFSALCFVPCNWRQAMCLACLHPRQARKNVGEVFTNINFQAAAVFHNGVEDGAFAEFDDEAISCRSS